MQAKFIFMGMVFVVWLAGLGSIIVMGNIQSDVLKNNQHTQSSAENPVTLSLKGRDFNVSCQQKLVYEVADLMSSAAIPLFLLLVFFGRRSLSEYKVLPPMQVIEGASTKANPPGRRGSDNP